MKRKIFIIISILSLILSVTSCSFIGYNSSSSSNLSPTISSNQADSSSETPSTTTETPSTTTEVPSTTTNTPSTTTNTHSTTTTSSELYKYDYDLSGISFDDLSLTYDGESHSILIAGDLPDGLSVEYEGNNQINCGVYEVVANFINTNTEYNDPEPLYATLTINKLSYDMSNISFEDKEYVYDGEYHTITIDGTLPDGISVSYLNNTLISAGSTTAYAIFSSSNDNYETPEPLSATLTIDKANYNLSNITLEDKTVDYDGTVHSLKIGGELPSGVIVNYTNNDKIKAGVYTVTATFTGDEDNYNTITKTLSATLTINATEADNDGLTSYTAISTNNNINYNLLIESINATFDVKEENNSLALIITSLGESEITFSGTYYGGITITYSDESDLTNELVINLAGSSIISSINCPLYIDVAVDIEISANKDTSNEIIDERNTVDDDSISASIYSTSDLKLKGKGTLSVESKNNNGIHSKDDLDIKNLTLYVKCVDNALKGNDSVTIESGNITLIATDGDGIKTNNSSISSQGNQKGIVTIESGNIDIYSSYDGIDAAYDVIINGGTINVYTDKYSSYSEESTKSANTLYIKVSSRYSSYNYALYLYNSNSTGEFVSLSYIGSSSSNMRGGTYYYYNASINSSYSNVMVYAFNQGQSLSQTSYVAKSSGGSINSSLNMISISLSGSTIQTNWGTYTTSSTDKTAKGIKSDNEIIIAGGTISINANDDGIHTNSDVLLETNKYGSGNITINGGTINIVSADDGIHADGTLLISDGTINVTKSHEGLEGNIINITGGTTIVFGDDDGVNASKQINISGGLLDVTVNPNGDTDGIDSNGTITISGGVIITRGPNNMNMAPLDADSTMKMTGGILIVLGYAPRNLSTSGLIKTSSSNGLTKGNHTVTIGSLSISYSNTYSYSGTTTVYASSSATIS